MKRIRRIEPAEPVPVVFTVEERKLVIDHTFAGPNLTDRLGRAKKKNGRYTARLTLNDLDELLGYVAAEANHSKSKALRKRLDTLFARLQDELQSFDDGQWPKPLEPPRKAQPAKAKGRAKLSLVKGPEEP